MCNFLVAYSVQFIFTNRVFVLFSVQYSSGSMP